MCNTYNFYHQKEKKKSRMRFLCVWKIPFKLNSRMRSFKEEENSIFTPFMHIHIHLYDLNTFLLLTKSFSISRKQREQTALSKYERKKSVINFSFSSFHHPHLKPCAANKYLTNAKGIRAKILSRMILTKEEFPLLLSSYYVIYSIALELFSERALFYCLYFRSFFFFIFVFLLALHSSLDFLLKFTRVNILI